MKVARSPGLPENVDRLLRAVVRELEDPEHVIALNARVVRRACEMLLADSTANVAALLDALTAERALSDAHADAYGLEDRLRLNWHEARDRLAEMVEEES